MVTSNDTPAQAARPAGRAAGSGPGQRRLNGTQTSGREYRNLSEVQFSMDRTNSADIPLRDGTKLRADVFLPTTGKPRAVTSTDGVVYTDADTWTAPALVSFSCYPRQIQEMEAESMKSDELELFPANFQVDELSKVLNPFVDKIVKNEAQPTPSFMKEINDAVQRVLDLPREGG